jgi:hypothetical protein
MSLYVSRDVTRHHIDEANRLRRRVRVLEAAIRAHQDARGDDARAVDRELYATLDEAGRD